MFCQAWPIGKQSAGNQYGTPKAFFFFQCTNLSPSWKHKPDTRLLEPFSLILAVFFYLLSEIVLKYENCSLPKKQKSPGRCEYFLPLAANPYQKAFWKISQLDVVFTLKHEAVHRMVYMALPSVWVSDLPVPAPRPETTCIYSAARSSAFKKAESYFLSATQHRHVHMNGKKML